MHKKTRTIRKTVLALAAIVGVLTLGLAGGATAIDYVTSPEIKNGAVHSEDLADGGTRSTDLRDGGVHADDLADGLNNRVSVGRITRIEADGPYPGATDLGDFAGQGDNSDELVPADGQVHTVWVQCASDKTALGGGFTLAADAGTAAAAATQVVASYPTQVENGAIVYDPIAGDDAGSYLANGWAVDAINNGSNPVVVRPWVVCAKVTQ